MIAVLWQAFLARQYAVPLRPAGRLALFLTVWSIYIADRLLDVRGPAEIAESARHQFYRRHKHFAAGLLAVLLIAALTIAVLELRPIVLRNGLIPLGAVLVYLGALNVWGTGQVAKELVVAFVFTTGTFLVAWTNDPVSPATLLAPATAFFLLCLANLTAIEAWEWRELRDGAGPPHGTTQALVRYIRIWVPVFAAAALLTTGPWYRAIGLSAASMSALIYAGRRLPIELRRVLVDGVMLTPLWSLLSAR